ncbi:MAG TPA: hypothetical protein VLG12_00755 [Candidatus Saccharimonadales bacterium]|nr:hypothetical protein [Candidatus Saccharimonadales bacterium]
MKEIFYHTKEVTKAPTGGTEASRAVLKWLNHAKNTVAGKIIWLGKELKVLTLTTTYLTGAAGIAAGIGLHIGGKYYLQHRKERLKQKYRGGGGGH